jgi:hypothetical protein
VVFIKRSAGRISVTVDDAVIAPHIARALEHWLEAVLPQLKPYMDGDNSSASACHNSTEQHLNSTGGASRRLLLFRELVLAVEERVRVGWDQAGSMHEAFSQTISQLLTYDYKKTTAQEWPPLQSFSNDQCDELGVLLAVCSETVEGVFNGWLTLTHERGRLQAQPATLLRDAWPQLLRPQGEDAVPDEALFVDKNNTGGDFLSQTCADAANATLQALNITPHIVYDLFYSVASAANESFTCPYAAVQTCSAWRRRLWQSIIIVLVWFSAGALLISILGLSFVNGLLVPLFATVTLQLCYGYTWACVPMVPVCAWQDFTETVNTLLPLSLEVPTTLKKIDSECLTRKSNCVPDTDADRCLQLQRYPPARCLKTCRDKPFDFNSWTNVLAWALAEVGPWATKFAFANAHRVPLFDHKAFEQDLHTRISTLQRTSPDSVSAHRVCGVLSSYLILPYLVLVVFVLVAVGSLAQALTSMFFPFFVVVAALFTCVLVSDQDHEKLLRIEATLEKTADEPKTRAARKRPRETRSHDTRLHIESDQLGI